MDNELEFYEFEQIYLAYVWVNVVNVSNIHPGILLIKKPFDIKNLNKNTLKVAKYFIYINLNGILKSINIKFVESLTNRKEFKSRELLNLYDAYLSSVGNKPKVINEDFLKV